MAAEANTEPSAPPPPVAEKKKHAREDDEHVLPHNNLILVFIALMMTAFLAALDQTIVATALPTIVNDLGGGKSYSWVGRYDPLILPAALCLRRRASSPARTSSLLPPSPPTYGKLSDIFGRKKILYPSIVIFLVSRVESSAQTRPLGDKIAYHRRQFGSGLCGGAKSMTWLIIARAIQGIGGGGIQQLVQIIIGDIVPLEQRGSYGSFIGAMWGIAGVVGPLVGGALTDHVSWRWAFWINLPTGGVAGLLLFWHLNLNPHHGRTLREHVQEFDFAGERVLFCRRRGDRPATIALLVVGIVLIVVGVWWESYTERSPLIPPRLFQTRTTGIIFLTVFLHSFCFFCAAYYLPLYFQILGASATRSGILIIPFSLLSSATSAMGGFIVTLMGDFRPVMWFSYGIMAIGYGLMILLNERTSLALQIIYPAIAGIGLGFLFLPPLIGMQAAMPVRDMATSSTTFGLFRILGSTIGIAVGQTIWSSILQRNLRAIPNLGSLLASQTPPVDLLSSAANLADSIHAIQGLQPDALKHRVQHAYTSGVSAIWVLCTPIVGVCFVVVFFMKKYSLKRKIVRTGKDGKAEVVPESQQVTVGDVEKQEQEQATVEGTAEGTRTATAEGDADEKASVVGTVEDKK
ncbi:Membrane transporter [Mycena kentingensis (nom. inval.)]|nr:Membrane transporter [Mycena kentingensis (nom. inval.)]